MCQCSIADGMGGFFRCDLDKEWLFRDALGIRVKIRPFRSRRLFGAFFAYFFNR